MIKKTVKEIILNDGYFTEKRSDYQATREISINKINYIYTYETDKLFVSEIINGINKYTELKSSYTIY